MFWLCATVATLAVVATDAVRETKTSFVPIKLPTDFASYDVDTNGYVEIQELANVSDTTVEESSKPFEAADVNIDGLISENEFYSAPWDLSGGQMRLRSRQSSPEVASEQKDTRTKLRTVNGEPGIGDNENGIGDHESGMTDDKFAMDKSKSRMDDDENGIRDGKSGMVDDKFGMDEGKSRMDDSENGIRGGKSGMSDNQFEVDEGKSGMDKEDKNENGIDESGVIDAKSKTDEDKLGMVDYKSETITEKYGKDNGKSAMIKD
ncbi:PREDICTED: uncharacterized protein LOC106814582 [Priapulus caudatus]|uniref:Uncharacterized protein LOC106814582 n=1 Tax=Priapulus caudatus TaxID=37621 RepID=A0ABM1EQD8_PRICU|nr:PREDICTED: uncharacterized protein LOC106814582 [Priapulus caudatus]